MKFGEHLAKNKQAEWSQYYVDYKALKKLIKACTAASVVTNAQLPEGQPKGVASLSVPRIKADQEEEQEEEQQEGTEEDFFVLLEREVKKVQDFTHLRVTELREQLRKLKRDVPLLSEASGDKLVDLRARTEAVGNTFLKLEKYVNLNFTAFYKILKKHDKNLPNSPPCRTFYMSRLHNQSWVRGDYSDVLVTLSDLYAQLRGDQGGVATDSAMGSFTRSTTKYWVTMEHVSEVKYAILQHLPVFLQKQMGGESDSQLINSVYLDNAQLELYHGRLDKTAGAIALRIRWYGTGKPKLCFVERKTHRDSWTGEVSVKERFTVSEDEVMSVLNGTYDVEKAEQKLRDKGKGADEIAEWRQLVNECLQAIVSKQLVPTMRSQYMRTAFQIPYDATVRVSLDTNLCMINDRDPGGDRWYRDPTKPVPNNCITRFPHAILEVKLQVKEGEETPRWIADLLQTDLVQEVHKFSKFIHGCATLLPDDVQSVPYWVDDFSVRESMINSGARNVLGMPGEPVHGANKVFDHLLPFTKPEGGDARQVQMEKLAVARKASVRPPPRMGSINGGVYAGDDHEDYCEMCCGWCTGQCDEDGICEKLFPCIGAFGGSEQFGMRSQKVEPKLYFANERTFIHWLHMAVTLSSVSIGVLAFTKTNATSQYYALAVLPVALLFVVYSLYIMLWRNERIKHRVPTRWDNPFGPLFLGSSLTIALMINFCLKVYSLYFAVPAH